jgi:hypothetical protein
MITSAQREFVVKTARSIEEQEERKAARDNGNVANHRRRQRGRRAALPYRQATAQR